MRFIEIPALITEDIEDPSIVEITEPITVSISGTTMTIDGGSKVSGEASVTLTGDVTVNAFTLQNVKQPSIHKISVKTGRKGNFTYVPNITVTASSVSTTTKTGSDFEILLITTTGGETYVDFDMADYVSPALYTSNALTGFDISELTSTYGATAKLYKPDVTLLTTVSSAEAGSAVNFGYSETTPQDVTYTLEVTDDLGRTSRYDLPRKWISYAMETNSTPGFEKLALAGNEYTSTTIVPNLTSTSKVRVHKTGNHGYLGINFKIQGRNSTNGAWVNIDDTGENENDDESKEFLAFGDYLYHRVWVKPTAKATTTVSSSNVVTLTLSNLTEENVTTSFTGADPFDLNESTNTYVFEETTKIGTVPYTVTLGSETYTNAVTATTEGTAYDYVTLAFANPTLSLTTSNVTISSAKLYRDDVLFHTYGTESNVVLRSDQTGTYQAIVNDVYYSNRVVPDFTTTRSVSAPQLEFDGYNRLNLSNITPTSTTLGVPDGTTRDLTTQSKVYIYKSGTYTANVQTSETFAYLSNTTGNLGTSTNDVSPSATTISFYAGTWNGSYEYQLDTSQTTDSAIFYELYNIGGSAADNRHGLEFRKETDGSTKVYAETASNSLHPYTISINSNTPTASVTISGQVGQILKGFNSSTLVFEFTITSDHLWTTPKPSFDGFNKLAIENITQTSSTLKYGSNTYDTNTASNVYVTDAGEYKLEARDANTFVMSNVYVGGVSQHPSDVVPTLTFDGYNKLTIDNVDTVETATIKKDGAAFATTTSNTVYIRDTGTYTAEVKGSDEYAIELSKEVSAINNAPDITITFHYDTFTNSGDPYSDGSVTAAATAGHIFSDTDTTISYTWGTLDSASTANRQTTYTWTPASTVTAKVLMVAGGGGGGNSDNNNGGGGGGGAGGVVYNASVSLSGQQTIVVGGNNNSVTGNGSDTEFTGLTTAIGGGKGGGAGGAGASGGSGGGAFRNGTGSAGTEGQGYAGGDGSSTYSPSIDQGGSGGGGAGGAGAGANDANGANGGVGLDYSSVFGTTYGDSGWFASGGGGGFHSGSPGTASNGGGGNGGGSSGSAGANGQKHTGGGGGGGSIASGTGSYGGTGIVLVQFSPLPSITYDGKNKLTVSGTNYADTSNVTYYSNTYNLGTAKTMYVKDTGEYVFKISGTDKYVESNVYVSSVDLAGAPTKPIDFDGYNKLTLIDAGSNVSANVTYFSNTYELGSANVLYINGAGTYDLEMSGSNVFALSSNVVGTVSQHPTDVVPSLTFDNYNKLTLENFTTSESDTRTAKLTDPNGNTYSLSQTQNEIYIEDTGEYILEVTNSDQSAVVTKNVGTVSQHPTDVVPSLTFDTYNKLSIGNLTPNSSSLRLGSNTYEIGTASNVYIEDAGTYKVATGDATTFALVSNVVTGTPSQHPTDVVPSLTYDNANKLSIENLTPTSTTLTDPNGSSFDIGTASNVYIRDSGTYSIASKDANTFVLASNTVTGTPTGTTYVYDSNTFTTPSQTYDTTKTITVSNVPSTQTGITGKIYKGATAYTIHATTSSSNVIIKNTGTYVSVFTTATQAFLTNAIGVTTQPTTTSDDTTIEDAAPIVTTTVVGEPLTYKAYLKTGINVNASTSWTAYDIFGSGYSEEINQGGFTLANSNLVAPETGYYRLSFNIYLYSDGQRTNVGVKPVVEGTELNEISASDYIRGGTGHNEASTAMSTIVYLSGNKEVNLKFARLTDITTSVTVQSGSFITLEKIKGPTITTTTTTGGLAGSTAVPDETTTDAPSVTLDATDTTVTDPTLDLDFTTTLPRTLKRYNGVTNSSIGARFNRRETYKKRIEKSINISTRFSAELTANNASSPTTLTFTVANSKFVINGDETPTLGFIRGETYTFDQSDASNSGHPLVLATPEDGATQYTTGWTTTPSSPDYVPGVSGAQGTFIVPYDVPDTIYYKCNVHPNMGGEINTTFGNVFSLGDFTVAANTHVSGEYTLATNYDGTTSNLYVNGDLITQTTPTISVGVKEFILGKEFDGYVKNFKFWNYAKSFLQQ